MKIKTMKLLAILFLFGSGCSRGKSSSVTTVTDTSTTDSLKAQLANAQIAAAADANKLTNGAAFKSCMTAAESAKDPASARTACNSIAY